MAKDDLMDDDRIGDIRYWYDGHVGTFAAVSKGEPRLREAFQAVLLALPSDLFEKFLELNPLLICQPNIKGTVWQFHFPVFPPGSEMVVRTVIYLSPDFEKWKQHKLLTVVAHEVAHVVLGHAGHDCDGGAETEEAADVLVKQIGFKPAYNNYDRFKKKEE